MAYNILRFDRKLNKARALIDFFDDRNFMTVDYFSIGAIGLNGYIFRGLSNDNYCNKPKAFRNGYLLAQYAPQSPGNLQSHPDQQQLRDYILYQLNAELTAVQLFTETADRLGIPTSLDYTVLKEAYQAGFHFLEQSSDLQEQLEEVKKKTFPPEQLLETFGLAQHHGIPTRLLDWTESPFVACFFAEYKVSSVFPVEQQKKTRRIYAYFISHTHLEKLKLELIMAPRYRNEFLRAQKALFLHFPKANEYFIEHRKWPTLEDVADLHLDAKHFIAGRVSVPANQADEVLRILWDLGLRRETLMPSLSNAAEVFMYRKSLFGYSPVRPGICRM